MNKRKLFICAICVSLLCSINIAYADDSDSAGTPTNDVKVSETNYDDTATYYERIKGYHKSPEDKGGSYVEIWWDHKELLPHGSYVPTPVELKCKATWGPNAKVWGILRFMDGYIDESLPLNQQRSYLRKDIFPRHPGQNVEFTHTYKPWSGRGDYKPIGCYVQMNTYDGADRNQVSADMMWDFVVEADSEYFTISTDTNKEPGKIIVNASTGRVNGPPMSKITFTNTKTGEVKEYGVKGEPWKIEGYKIPCYSSTEYKIEIDYTKGRKLSTTLTTPSWSGIPSGPEDKVGPTLNVTPPQEPDVWFKAEDGITFNVDATDDKSGISKIEYKTSNDSTKFSNMISRTITLFLHGKTV